jgi:hypothetical protein
MARKIDSLLNKKGWTGVEVGKALVASIIHDIRHQSEPDYKPLFSQSDFDKMESSLNTERDYLAYGVYRDLYSGLIDAYNRGQGQHQQFYNGYYRYAMHLKDCTVAEQTLQTAELTPYVMTQEQYNKLKEQRETTLKGFTESFSRLLFTLLSHIMSNPEDAPEDIRTAIEATKKEAVTNERILSTYCEVYGMGYYKLPDGTRSDNLEGEEWREKLKEEYLKTHKLRINGKQASFEDTILHYNTERRLKGYELFFTGIDAVKALYEDHTGETLPPEDEVGIMKALESLLNLRDDENPVEKNTVPLHPAVLQIKDIVEGEMLGSGAEWHYYKEAPAELTKYDIIAESLCFYDGEESEDGEPQLKEFKADYPALYKALEAYIKELVPQARDLKPTQYSKEFITWGELAELKVGRYPAYCIADDVTDILEALAETDEDTTENLLKRKRLMFNGIVIAQAPNAYQLNERGEYIDNIKHILGFSSVFSIDSIGKSESTKEDIQAFRDNLFLPALQYLYAFNALVKILGAIYDLDELGEVEISTERFESQLEALNNQLYMLYGDVYGTDADKERKRDIIKEVFQPINLDELKPTAEAIETVTAELDRLGFSTEARKKLKKFDALIERLCERGL